MSDPHALASGQDLGPTLSGQERTHPGGIGPKERRKVVVASFIGNFTEWFDYGAYSYLAVVIATVFFPSDDLTEGLVWTFALFAASFLVRPIGGFIWGHIGDRVGRKTALAWSILIMSGATVCIGLLPGAAQLGLWPQPYYSYSDYYKALALQASTPVPQPSSLNMPRPINAACTPPWYPVQQQPAYYLAH